MLTLTSRKLCTKPSSAIISSVGACLNGPQLRLTPLIGFAVGGVMHPPAIDSFCHPAPKKPCQSVTMPKADHRQRARQRSVWCRPMACAHANNLYCSRECVFISKLRGVLFVVLSNNDGCCIARSQDYVESVSRSSSGRLFPSAVIGRAEARSNLFALGQISRSSANHVLCCSTDRLHCDLHLIVPIAARYIKSAKRNGRVWVKNCDIAEIGIANDGFKNLVIG